MHAGSSARNELYKHKIGKKKSTYRTTYSVCRFFKSAKVDSSKFEIPFLESSLQEKTRLNEIGETTTAGAEWHSIT